MAADPASFPSLADRERMHIPSALEHARRNRTQAAKNLEISIRTLRNKLHEYGVADLEEVLPPQSTSQAQGTISFRL